VEVLEASFPAVRIGVIRDRRTVALDRFQKHLNDGSVKGSRPCFTDASCKGARMDACAEETLVRVDVADPAQDV
jgi:hypothetical protein